MRWIHAKISSARARALRRAELSSFLESHKDDTIILTPAVQPSACCNSIMYLYLTKDTYEVT
jgi:hypothetical protein